MARLKGRSMARLVHQMGPPGESGWRPDESARLSDLAEPQGPATVSTHLPEVRGAVRQAESEVERESLPAFPAPFSRRAGDRKDPRPSHVSVRHLSNLRGDCLTYTRPMLAGCRSQRFRMSSLRLTIGRRSGPMSDVTGGTSYVGSSPRPARSTSPVSARHSSNISAARLTTCRSWSSGGRDMST